MLIYIAMKFIGQKNTKKNKYSCYAMQTIASKMVKTKALKSRDNSKLGRSKF